MLAWTVRAYRRSMRGFAQMSNLAVWYAKLNAQDIMGVVRAQQLVKGKRLAEDGTKRSGKARSKNSTRAVLKLTEAVNGELRFVSEPPLIVPLEELLGESRARSTTRAVAGMLADYRDSLSDDHGALLDSYSFQSIARKVVGVGQRGHTRVGDAVHGSRRERSARPAGQGSPGVGTRAICGCLASTPTTASASWRASA